MWIRKETRIDERNFGDDMKDEKRETEKKRITRQGRDIIMMDWSREDQRPMQQNKLKWCPVYLLFGNLKCLKLTRSFPKKKMAKKKKLKRKCINVKCVNVLRPKQMDQNKFIFPSFCAWKPRGHHSSVRQIMKEVETCTLQTSCTSDLNISKGKEITVKYAESIDLEWFECTCTPVRFCSQLQFRSKNKWIVIENFFVKIKHNHPSHIASFSASTAFPTRTPTHLRIPIPTSPPSPPCFHQAAPQLVPPPSPSQRAPRLPASSRVGPLHVDAAGR